MRTLLISIEDNKNAKLFVEELARRQGLLESEQVLTENEFAELCRDNLHMDAMVARPTVGCTCGATKGAGRRTTGFVQSPNYHWLIHAKKGCMKPTEYVVRHWISNMCNGAKDLLDTIIPNHEEVKDYLDRGARFRVHRQYRRDELAELARQR